MSSPCADPLIAPALVVFAGLPGSGKSRLAALVADELTATCLRVDTIEAAITSTLTHFSGNPVGYVAAEWVAEDQLDRGRGVVVDAVNGIEKARDHWRGLSHRTGARLTWVEVICSDPVEHRRRVESRVAHRPGAGVPTWQQVQRRTWEPFTEPRLLIDNLSDATWHCEEIIRHVRSR